MRDGLVNIAPDFTKPNYNFWDDNMQLSIMKPFNKLYDRDKTDNKSRSTKEMVVIFFMNEPDPELNKFYRIPFSERLIMLKDTYYDKFDEEDEAIKECMEQYPHLCMTAIKRALKEEIDTMVDRSITLRNSPYTLDYYLLDDDGEYVLNNSGAPIKMTGTAAQLDTLRSKTTKLMDDYAKIEERFIKEKSESRIKGGRRRSKAEKKLL